MTRRDWLWTLGAGLWGCLGAGCLNLFPERETVYDQVPPDPVWVADVRPTPPEAVSPYAPHPPVPTVVIRKTEAPATATVSRAPSTAPASKAAGLGPVTELVPDITPAGNAEESAAPKPPDDPALVVALRYFLDKRPDEALERLKGYDKGNQELLLGLFPLAARLTEGSLTRAKPEEIENLVNSFDNLLEPLRVRLPLSIGKLCFCSAIHSFGDYDPLPENHKFRPGEQMQIYIELRNFRTHEVKRLGGETRYVIRLASSFVIAEDDEPHKTVRKGTFLRDRPEGADESRTPRHDYFENYSFPVPDLPPGPYNLVIQVEDRGCNPPRTIQGKPLYFYVTNPNLPAPDPGRGID